MCLERLNGGSTYTYLWYNNDHDANVYTVVNDTQGECGQPHHLFQKSLFCSVYTETQPQSFQTKAAVFSKVSVFEGRVV